MKRVLFLALSIFFINACFAHAYTSPGKPQGFVNDFAQIISPENKTAIESKLNALNKDSGIQIAVVTIPKLSDETIETYSYKLFQEWGIGQKGKDNGVLFLIAPNEKELRIEVGYGLEGVLTDAQSNKIIQKIVIPEFKNNDLNSGISKGVDAIISVVKGDAISLPNEASDSNAASDSTLSFISIAVIFVVSLLSRTKSWWLGGVFGFASGIFLGFHYSSLSIGFFATIILTILGLIIDYILSKFGGTGGGFWMGGMGGSGSSGGFGGFGGGFSGGGGSSGKW